MDEVFLEAITLNGYLAGRSGQPAGSNPHGRTDYATAWLKGWIDGKSDHLSGDLYSDTSLLA